MKKILCCLLSCLLLISLTACSNSGNRQLSGKTADVPEQPQNLAKEESTSAPDMSAFITVSEKQTAQSPRVKQLKSNRSKKTKPAAKPSRSKVKPAETSKADESMVNIQISAGNKTFSAKLYDNQTTQAFIKQMPLTITMDELNGNEKFYYFKDGLPTDSHKPSGMKAGDLMLYGSDCLVLFYESFSTSYSYTRLGAVEDPEGLDDALGNGSVKVTFKLQSENSEVNEKMKIRIKGNSNTIVFELNGSPAAKDLYEQLPLTTEVQNFSTNEKVFYPPKKLTTKDTPSADAEKGTLCYYSPWGDVVMFYEDYGKGSSLYELGKVVSGREDIKKLSGMIEITAEHGKTRY